MQYTSTLYLLVFSPKSLAIVQYLQNKSKDKQTRWEHHDKLIIYISDQGVWKYLTKINTLDIGKGNVFELIMEEKEVQPSLDVDGFNLHKNIYNPL